MEIISLDQVLKVMEAVDASGAPIPFAITAVTCDLHRNRGGERLVYTAAVLCKTVPSTKKAYYYRNNTRNIKGQGNNEIRAIHPLLITHFNGKEVSY
jgi:hypothetical protein